MGSDERVRRRDSPVCAAVQVVRGYVHGPTAVGDRLLMCGGPLANSKSSGSGHRRSARAPQRRQAGWSIPVSRVNISALDCRIESRVAAGRLGVDAFALA